MQLHRDTTISSLTLSPSLRDGVVHYEDSALVRALRHGLPAPPRCVAVPGCVAVSARGRRPLPLPSRIRVRVRACAW